MKTVRFHKTGGPEVLQIDEVADPVPKAGEVLIKVEAVGLNFADVLRRRGDAYPEPSPTPFTLGGEVAGEVVGWGPGVTSPAIGSFVFGACRTGGYAQYVTMPAASVILVPPGINAAQATSLVIQGLTAFFALEEAARLDAGESVLVEAAAGGVGSFAVQLAKLFGAGLVIAAAGSDEKRARALELGADAAVDYTRDDWADAVKALTKGKGVDVVLEMTGGPTLGRALDSMAPFGRMVVYGLASAETALVDPQQLTAPNQTVRGFYIGGYFANPKQIDAALNEIVDHVLEGRLTLEVGASFPLSQAADAHRLLEGRHSTGKVVLMPWASDAPEQAATPSIVIDGTSRA